MGEVYRGEDLKLGAPVALKFLPATLARDAERVRRFYEEVRIGRQVSHPNVCRIYDVAEVEGLRFLSMEYVDGEDLASLLRRIGRLPLEKAIDVSRDLCAGLAAAHDLGIVHRDLKPANVMLDGRGRARITDFGLAALASDLEEGRSLAGTPAYLPPEQLEGGAATARGDLYSLGLVLFELLTGKRPFEGKTAAQIAEQAQEGRQPRVSAFVPEVPPSVDRIIARCLDRDPLQRPSSAREVMTALPGGNPLQAAVAAGVTPAPEVVAAAGAVGGLPAGTVWSWLGAVAAGIALLGLLGNSTRLSRLVPFDKPPVLLEERAREILRGQGYSEPGVYRWRFLFPDEPYLRHVARADLSPRRWEALRKGEPPAAYFLYLESPAPLDSAAHWSGFSDAPWTVAGQRGVRLDTRGLLNELVVVSPKWEESGGGGGEPRWRSLFQEAGLDLGSFSPVEPRLMPPVGFDRRAAWDGFHPARRDIPLQVEAASYRGRPVFFALIRPWDAREDRVVGRVSRSGRPAEFRGSAGETLQELAKLGAVMLGIAGAGLVARRNWRLGRADRHGAAVVAGFIAATSLLSWLFQSGHVLSVRTEGGRLARALENALLVASAGWVMYLALEPLARRRAPQALISWSRLLAGRLRDPLVGHHVLVGVVFGLLLQALNGLLAWIPTRSLSPNGVGIPRS
jgi:serine/threonine-protein kinase